MPDRTRLARMIVIACCPRSACRRHGRPVHGNRDANRLLLVGHNPGLEQLAALMHSGQTGDYRGMPPAGIAVLKLPVDAAIEPGIASLTAFWWP